VAHLEAAHAIWDYSAASAALIFGPDLKGDTDRDQLLEAFREGGGRPQPNGGVRSVFSGHRTAQQLHNLRTMLENAGHVVTVQQSTSGRNRILTFAADGEDSRAEEAKKSEQGCTAPAPSCPYFA
jgi:hypothetical protein